MRKPRPFAIQIVQPGVQRLFVDRTLIAKNDDPFPLHLIADRWELVVLVHNARCGMGWRNLDASSVHPAQTVDRPVFARCPKATSIASAARAAATCTASYRYTGRQTGGPTTHANGGTVMFRALRKEAAEARCMPRIGNRGPRNTLHRQSDAENDHDPDGRSD